MLPSQRKKNMKKDYNYSKNKHCECGKLITNSSTCCYKCNGKLHGLNFKGKKHPLFGKKRLDTTLRNKLKGINKPKCINCDKELSDYRAKRCSHCSKIGKNNNNFIDGTSGIYPLKFNNQLKEFIRNRDNYQCQNCSMTEEEHLIVVGKVLAVHHIDYDKENCNEYNLITLCDSCNIRSNYNRNYWQEVYTNKILK